MNSDEEIDEFIRSFETCSLPRSRWTHHAHLVVALWYLSRFPREEATRRIRHGIQTYNAAQGNTTGYHETITLAWIEVVDRFLSANDGSRPLAELARELISAVEGRHYLYRYYSPGVLGSGEARLRWTPPDLADFDPWPPPTHKVTVGPTSPKGPRKN